MKNLTLLITLFVLTLGMNTQIAAQESEGAFLFEAGVGYGSEIQSLGFQAGGLYSLESPFRIDVDAIYYLTGEDSNGVDFNWLEFNANGHWLFLQKDETNVYLLSGLNFAKLFSDSDDIELPSGDSKDQIYVGVNIGAGAEISLGSIRGYIEGKHALSSAHQLAFTAGIRIPL